MPYQKTIWKNREVEKPRTFRVQNNPDGTITLVPAEGNIIEAGTPIIAENMNKIEDAVEDVDDKVAQHLAQNASTTQAGHVQLTSVVDSDSEVLGATAKAVKLAYEKAEQAFTQANDIKTKVSNVVGAPLTNTDTSDQMVTKIQTIKNTLASNLTAKGQMSSGTESLTSLVNKVPNINTGKRVHTGTVVCNPNETITISVPFIPGFIRVWYLNDECIASKSKRDAGGIARNNSALNVNAIRDDSFTFFFAINASYATVNYEVVER